MKIDKAKLLVTLGKKISRKKLSLDSRDLQNHSKDRSFHKESLPDVVIWPETSKDVSKVLKLANKFKIPVTAWGGGSSLEGNPISVKGGIVLDMTKMNKIIKVLPEDFQVRVQPGIIGDDLNKKLTKYNLFFPAFAGSSYIATLGGMVANNAGGMYGVKYGVVGDWVMSLEVVLASGQVIKIGSSSVKTVAGYNLLDLFIGSEGTLGIITEATLRLKTIPADKLTVLTSFQSIDKAMKTALDIMYSPVEPAAMEFMEKDYINLVNEATKLGWDENPSLIIELHGAKEKLKIDLENMNNICNKNSCVSFYVADTPEKIKKIWDGRRGVRPAIAKILPDAGILPGDIGVPLSQIGKYIHKVQITGKKYNIKTVTFGHAGDGNFHTWMIYNQKEKETFKRAKKVSEELVKYAISLGGTSTAEHGVGIGKRKYLQLEHPTSLKYMREIKRLFDPKGILNPGKIFLD